MKINELVKYGVFVKMPDGVERRMFGISSPSIKLTQDP